MYLLVEDVVQLLGEEYTDGKEVGQDPQNSESALQKAIL
jgi:hypothetical protein